MNLNAEPTISVAIDRSSGWISPIASIVVNPSIMPKITAKHPLVITYLTT